MCNFGKAFRRALDIDVEAPQLPAGGKAPSQDATQAEIAKALKAQADAQAAEAAALDTEGRQVEDAARRRRLRLSEPGSIGSFFNAGMGQPAQSGMRMLYGS